MSATVSQKMTDQRLSLQKLSDLPASEVNHRLLAAFTDLQRAESNVVLLFYVVKMRRLYRELGHATIQVYAREELGWSENRIYQILRLVSDLERLPKLRKALFADEIGWTKAKEVSKIASAETEQAWLAEAKRSGRRQLVEKIKQVKQRATAERRRDPRQQSLADLTPSELPANELPTECGSISVTLRFTPRQLATYEAMVEKVRKSRQVPVAATREDIHLMGLCSLLEAGAEAGEALAAAQNKLHDSETTEPESAHQQSVSERSAVLSRGQCAINVQLVVHKCEVCGAGTIQTGQGAIRLPHAELEAAECDAVIIRPNERNRRIIPPSVRREVLSRDRFRCQAPGCLNHRFLEIHHRIERGKGGSNRPENLITLCSACHRLFHERRIRL